MIELDLAVKRPRFALNVTTTLPGQGITGVFGRSGAGKSTLIDAIAGLTGEARGCIRVGDLTYLDSARRFSLPIQQRQVGYVFQDAKLFPHLRVDANLSYGLRRAQRASRKLDWDTVVGVLDLEALLRRWPATLSGGERQRVALGRALLSQPRLLLMDEPLASLDAPRKTEILGYIERLQEVWQIPLLYVTHSLDELVRIADYLLLLAGGEVMASGPFLEMVAQPSLQPYLGRFEAGSVLECLVEHHDSVFGLTVLSFSGGELRVPRIQASVGTRLRARLRARDVALALTDPQEISITNRIHGIIASLTPREGPYVDVMIAAGNSLLHALVTRESCARLSLVPGLAVVALVKAVALDSRTVGYNRQARPDSGAGAAGAAQVVAPVRVGDAGDDDLAGPWAGRVDETSVAQIDPDV